MFLNGKGELIGKVGESSQKGVEATAGKVKRYIELAKSPAGNEIELAVLKGEVGVLDFEDLEEAIEGKELTADQKKRIGMLRTEAAITEIVTMLGAVRDVEARNAAMESAAEDFLKIYNAGDRPQSQMNKWYFWKILHRHAVAKKDVKLFEGCVAGYKEMFEDSPDSRVGSFLEKLDKELAEMKGAQVEK